MEKVKVVGGFCESSILTGTLFPLKISYGGIAGLDLAIKLSSREILVGLRMYLWRMRDCWRNWWNQLGCSGELDGLKWQKKSKCNHLKHTDEVLFDEYPPPNLAATDQVILILWSEMNDKCL